MGSKPSKSKPSRRKPAPPPQASSCEAAEQALQETRSILACAARCLDEITDPHELDAPEPCGPDDVAVVVRLGIQRLDEARESLDTADRP